MNSNALFLANIINFIKVTLLYTWNEHAIINQLYSDIK